MARSRVNEFRQRLKDTVSREVLQLVIGYIEAASEELTDSMIYADETDKTLRLQGQLRGYKDIVRNLSRVHD